MARTLNGRTAVGLLLVFGIVFLNGFFFWQRHTNRNIDVCFVETLGLHGKVAVALAFAERQAENALEAMKAWEAQKPCEHRGVSQHAALLVYGDMDMSSESEEARVLKEYAAKSASIQACFSEVAFISANLSDSDDIYDKARKNHLWTRGPNMMFYNLMFEQLTRLQIMEVQHIFWMEPDVTPLKTGWLDKLLVEASKGDYWIQGSSFRGKCLPNTEGKCEAIGRDIIAHINGNALYKIGDLSFVKFMYEVANGKFMHWPFDLAPLMHMQSVWTELEYRDKMHLYQRVDWIRNYGPYPFEQATLPSSVYFVHFSPPMIEGEFPSDQIVVPGIDEWMAGVIKAENALAQKAVDLERQVARLQAANTAHTYFTPLKR